MVGTVQDVKDCLSGTKLNSFKNEFQALIAAGLDPEIPNLIEHFNRLKQEAMDLSVSNIPYAFVAKTVYDAKNNDVGADTKDVDALNAFSDQFKTYLNDMLVDLSGGQELPKAFPVLLKLYEHIALANVQYKSLIKDKRVDELKRQFNGL
ncbi:hypothetical protein PT274_03170 [Leuconostocaceae bacterium ESL0958]|nr:hypothetical protein [Leuconostocaceae bacterium ESL0958]